MAVLNDLKDENELAEVIYATPTKQNVDLSYQSTPAALVTVLTDGTLDIARGYYKERAEVTVDFVTDMNNPTTDFEANELDTLLDGMAAVATDFVSALYHSTLVELIGDNVRVTYLYDFMDRNTTGVRVRCTLRERDGVCL